MAARSFRGRTWLSTDSTCCLNTWPQTTVWSSQLWWPFLPSGSSWCLSPEITMHYRYSKSQCMFPSPEPLPEFDLKRRRLNRRVLSIYIYFSVQEALSNLEDYDKTCVESALNGVSNVVQQEWGSACPCQVFCQVLCTISQLKLFLIKWSWYVKKNPLSYIL